MYDFHPYFTNDGSVGLYSPDFDDIYHSSTGALTEAYEKFIMPINMDEILKKDSIKILDICYGIGYNSKSFLNFIFEKNFLKKNKNFFSHADRNIKPIYTDNNISQKSTNYIDKIYGDNIFSEISITAIDNDKILAFLSPFIKTGKKYFKNKNFDFEKKNIGKHLKKDKRIKNHKIQKIINFLIFEKIAQNTPDFATNEAVMQILSSKEYAQFFEGDIRAIYRLENPRGYKSILEQILGPLMGFLHNIYYRHVTNRYKKDLKRYKLADINFDLKIDDARQVIKNDNNLYNLIFLDAFTPSKCPCLWSYEFFKLLYDHLESDGMILTYSTSAAIRSAMQEAGFYIGNIYNEREQKYTGTIATKNLDLINYPLSEYDLGLLKTSAGIFYRDENLTGQNEAIFAARKKEVENTDRISTSQYKKKFNKEEICKTTTF
jgi:tRNA U34 5-methylaminomethyl-2-thiouridine-forming methyltransferase MnmC